MKEFGFEPTADYLVIEPPKEIVSDTTESGIIKSEAMKAEEKKKMASQQYVTVIAVGKKVKDTIELKPGDQIILQHQNYDEGLFLNGKTYFLVHKMAVLGKKI